MKSTQNTVETPSAAAEKIAPTDPASTLPRFLRNVPVKRLATVEQIDQTNQQTGHTPGPWKVKRKPCYDPLCEIHNPKVSEFETYQTERIAYLEAQRDELLEALYSIAARANFMLVRNPQDNQADYILQQAKAAISKAEGR